MAICPINRTINRRALDIWVLGELLSIREMFHDLQKKKEKGTELDTFVPKIKAPPNMAHLIAYLRYKPFEGDLKARRYQQALAMKVIRQREYEGLAIPPQQLDEKAHYYPKWATAVMLWHGLPPTIYTERFESHWLPSEKLAFGTSVRPFDLAFIGHGEKGLLRISSKDFVSFKPFDKPSSMEHEYDADCGCPECRKVGLLRSAGTVIDFK